MGFVAETTPEARNIFQPGWQSMAARIGRERGWPSSSREQFEEMCGPQGAFLVGDPEAVEAKVVLAGRALGGVSRVTLQMGSAASEPVPMLRSIELLGRTVKPIVLRGHSA